MFWKLPFSSGIWKWNLNGSDPENAIRSTSACFSVELSGSLERGVKKNPKKTIKQNKFDWVFPTKMGGGFAEMVLQEKHRRSVQWDNTFYYNRFSNTLRRMAQGDIKHLVISLDFSTQVLFFWMSLPWITCCLCFSFPLFQSRLCLKSKCHLGIISNGVSWRACCVIKHCRIKLGKY